MISENMSININNSLDDNLYNKVRNTDGSLNEDILLQIFNSDFNSALIYTDEKLQKIFKWRREYDGLPYGNEVKGRSKYISRDIKKYSAWLQASIVDTFTSTPDIIRCYPANPQSTQIALNNEVLLNYQFCRQFNRYDFIANAISVLDTDGTLVIKTGWEYETNTMPIKTTTKVPLINKYTNEPITDEFGNQVFNIIDEKIETKEVVTKNNPTAMICRNEDIFIDPTCLGNINQARFIIHKFRTDLSTLKQDTSVKYKNLDKIPDQPIDPTYQKKENFTFSDKARKKIYVTEYWGYFDINGDGIVEPIVFSWVGNVCIRCEENPYPDKKPPFIVVPFLPKPFDIYGEPNGELIGSNQKIKTSIMRGINDNMANGINGQLIMSKGAVDSINRERMLRGESFETNLPPSNSIMIGNYNQLPQSIFSIIQLMDLDSQALTGVNPLGQFASSDLIGENNTSKGVLDGGNLRKLQIVRNIAENLIKPLLRKWIAYNQILLDDEIKIRVTGDNQFTNIRRDDLYGDIDIELSISTNEDNASRIQTLSMLLQTIGPSEDPNIRKYLIAEILRLHRMPELAKNLENYQPQPDPLLVAQQQLMIEKLKAEIQELQANAGKISSDSMLKQSKAQVESERAKNISANTDRSNLDFIRTQQGINEANEENKLDKELASKERIEKMKQDSKLASDLLKLQGEQIKLNGSNKQNMNNTKLDNTPIYSPKDNKEPRNKIKYRQNSPITED